MKIITVLDIMSGEIVYVNEAGASGAVCYIDEDGEFRPMFEKTEFLWYFLDDEREPAEKENTHWAIFRTGESIIEAIWRFGLPDGISFDHDLGEDRMSGHDTAKAILEMVLDRTVQLPDDFRFQVHSQNPIGAKNIKETMADAFRVVQRIKH